MVAISNDNPRYPGVPLNVPPFEWTDDLTYFDSMMGALSRPERKGMFLGIALLDGMNAIFLSTVVASILVNVKARRYPFNCFLLYSMTVDTIHALFSSITSMMSVAEGTISSVGMCKVQSVSIVFGVTANSWVNALVAIEVFKMLYYSNRRQRYFPPTRWTVAGRCMAAYLYALLLAIVGGLNFQNLPYKTVLNVGGVFCLPIPYDHTSSFVSLLVFYPAAMVIPFLIVSAVTAIILRRGYLPPQGNKKRTLAIYFFRLFAVFAFFWMLDVGCYSLVDWSIHG